MPLADQRQRHDRQGRDPETSGSRHQDPLDADAAVASSEAALIGRKGLRWGLVLGFLVAAGIWFGVIWVFGGVRTVIPGRVYRSPQLEAGTLQEAIRGYGLNSVLNLRGRGHGRTWFAAEQRVCQQAGIEHVTLSFDIDEWPPRPRVLEFLEIIDSIPQPFLMHCNRGVDRTGWAGAFVVLADGGRLKEAGRQLAPGSGHFCIRSRCPQHLFFAAYSRWLMEEGKKQSGSVFRRWVRKFYCPDPWNAGLEFGAGRPPEKMVGGEEQVFRMEVVNQDRKPWRLRESAVRVGIRARGPLESIPEVPVEGFIERRTTAVDLGRSVGGPAVLETGESGVFEVRVRMPSEPGLYLMQADLVMEHVHWFSEMGWPGLIWPVEIVKPIPENTERDQADG